MDKLRMCRRFIKSALVSSNSTFNSATGITTSYAYKPNTNDISTETVTRNLSPVTLAVYSYTYRADGLKTGEVDTTYNSDGTIQDTRTLSWQYDALDRLMQETSSDTASVSEAAVDALKAFVTNGAVTLTDEVANYLVDEAQKFLQGLNNLAQQSQSEVP